MYNEGGGSTAEQAQAAATEILSAMQTVAEAQTTGASANPTTTQQLLQNAVQFPTWSESLPQNGQTVSDGKQLVPDGKAVAFPGRELENTTDMPIEVLTKDYNPQAAPTEARTAESQITDAFLQLGKQTIAQAATGKKQSAPIDIDTLQQAVDSGKFLSREVAAPQELFTRANPQTMDILAQVKTGILANMQKGSNEFTIKLKPEGLGEITVKMTEAGGKVSMSIITGSQQTQNILNGEISSLREALRPMGAEISQVITQQEANLAQQSFSQQQQHSGKQEQRASHEWTQQTKEDEQSREQYASALKSALNAYI
ncbi:MAG: flagellar hook-length control protein FliK, partial [Angelakisella sp.]